MNPRGSRPIHPAESNLWSIPGKKGSCAMLGFLFGFNARLGRMHFFLGTIVLAVVMTAICFAIAAAIFQQSRRGYRPTEADFMTWPVIIAMLFFGWVTFTLQAMRIRDIGWDPVCVIPGWITAAIVDGLIAGKFPSWAIGPDHHGTIVGALINLALFGALLFWPSGDGDHSTPTFNATPPKPEGWSLRPSGASAPAARIAQATRAEFGRRGY
jgi:uncharacterized membrane protein YhaH (DUF805 family)